MSIVMLLAVLIVSVGLGYTEIPKMKKQKQTKELWTYSILLGLFTILAVLKCLGVKIPNPSDFVAWMYSPVTEITKAITQ